MTAAAALRIDAAALDAFARASGDRNPLHVDAAYARDTPFGEVVAYGALVAAHAVAALPARDGVLIASLHARFDGPVLPGRDHPLEIDGDTVRVLDVGRPIAEIAVVRTDGPAVAIPTGGPVGHRDVPAEADLEALAAGRAVGPQRWAPDWAAVAELDDRLGLTARGLDPGRLAALCYVSALVGMEVPGRAAMLSGCSLTFDGATDAAELSAATTVEGCEPRFRAVTLDAHLHAGSFRVAGEVRAFARSEAPTPDFAIARALAGDAPRLDGTVAVVAGASRGLGAALTHALAARGATVVAAYAVSRRAAEAMREGAGDAAGRIALVQADLATPEGATRLRDAALQAGAGRVDLLALCAAPAVAALPLNAPAGARAAELLTAHVALARAPLAALAGAVAEAGGEILLASSAFVEEPPPGYADYAGAKAATEALVRAAVVEDERLSALIARPPRMLTAMNATPLGAERSIRAEDVAAVLAARCLQRADGVQVVSDFTGEADPDPATAGGAGEPLADRDTLALAATFTLDPLDAPLRALLDRTGIELQIAYADYGQTVAALLDPASPLGALKRGAAVVLVRAEDLGGDDGDLTEAAAELGRAAASFAQRSPVPLALVLAPRADALRAGRRLELDDVDAALRAAAGEVTVLDWQDWASGLVPAAFDDPERLELAHIPYRPVAWTALAATVLRVWHALVTAPHKVLVLDCDETLWSGVVGEDGPDGVRVTPGHRRLQEWAMAQAGAGVLLCLVSKNEPADVQAALAREDMPLDWSAITATRIGWDDKSCGLRSLAEELNLANAAFAMLDDNPVEVSQIEAAVPEVLAVRVPSPRELPDLVGRLWAFDRLRVTAEDRTRGTSYRAERDRRAAAASVSFAEFIAGLELEIDVHPPREDQLERVAQLTLKTNQFNLSTRRRQLPELRALLAEPDVHCLACEVRDRFGDAGLVGVAILRHGGDVTVVDTLLLSCRVLGRGVEHELLAELGRRAEAAGSGTLELPFQASERNAPVRRFLDQAVGGSADDVYRLPSTAAAAVAFDPAAASGEADGRPDTAAPARPAPVHHRVLGRLLDELADLDELHGRLQPEAATAPAAPAGDALQAVAAALARVASVDAAEIGRRVTLERLRLTSLAVVDATAELERRFGRLPATLLFEHRTVGDVADALRERARALAGASAPEPADTPAPVPAGPPAPAAGGPVAIVGIAGRYPAAPDLDALWRLLEQGATPVARYDPARWGTGRGGTGDGPGFAPPAALLEDADRFDPLAFAISPREAEWMDPQQRHFLEVVLRALEDAGHTPASLGATVGVWAGVMAGDYALLAAAAAADDEALPHAERYQIANRVSWAFDLTGPSITVDTACSSSGVAVHEACAALRAGEVDAAIAGGVNLVLHPARHRAYSSMGMLSAHGRCASFGEDADGFVMGEGVGAVVLRRLADAHRDGDRVLAVVRGSHVNADGRTSGFTVPAPHAQADLVRGALGNGEVEAAEIGYVEAHGSGTSLGDPIEVRGLADALAGHPGGCRLGSIKSNLGHLEAAAGIAGLTKVVLQLQAGRLAPSLHAERLNPRIDFATTPLEHVGATAVPWDGPRCAGVSSFGAGGVNAHLVVAAPPQPPERPDPPGLHLVVLSAGNAQELAESARALAAAADARGVRLDDVAFTLRAGRVPGPWRAAIVARDRDELLSALQDVRGQAADAEDALAAEHARELAAAGRLEELGALWCSGAIDDLPLERGAARRVALPGRPLSRERYWLPDDIIVRALAAAGDPAGAAAPLASRPAPATPAECDSPEPVLRARRPVGAPIGDGGRRAPEELLVVDDADLADEEIRERLARIGEHATLVVLDDAPAAPDVRCALARRLAALALEPGAAHVHHVTADPATAAFGRAHAHESPRYRASCVHGGCDVDELGAVIASGATELVRGADGRLRRTALHPLETEPGSSPLRRRGVVILTGAGGGIARILAEHLVATHDARLVLAARSLEPGEDGDRVRVRADVTDRDDVARVVETARRLGGPHAVVHCAGILADGHFATQQRAAWDAVCAPKVRGARLLDEATAADELDLFCVMSSIVAATGNAGQTAYAAANGFLDAFAARREELVATGRRRGRSVAIAWPPWAEAGMRLDDAALRRFTQATGQDALPTDRALHCFDRALAASAPAVLVTTGEPRVVAEEARTTTAAPAAGTAGAGDLAWPVAEDAAALAKLDPARLDHGRELSAYGFDSVMLTALAERLTERFGIEVTAVDLFEHPTIAGLAAALAGRGARERRDAAPRPAVIAEPAADEPTTAARPVAHEPSAPDADGAVAIVGWSGRFPGAADPDALWEQLRDGIDAVTDPPPGRGPASGDLVPRGGYLADLDAFDAGLFGIAPREARLMDPQQRLFLEAAWSALEDAGHDPRNLAAARAGVFAGVTLTDYLELLLDHEPDVGAHVVTGTVHSIVANRVSWLLDLRGPSEAVDAACASSLVAVHRAIRSLRAGECDLALAGGVNVLLSPTWYASLGRAGMLSQAGRCHTFDARADGYVRGEGVGVVVLRRLADAVADGDDIHAVVRGSAAGHGGRSQSLTAPSPAGQAAVIAAALRDAGIAPSSIGYVEAHGTGTRLGDPVELRGLREALGQPRGVVVGAAKASVGHLESAAGVTGLIAAASAIAAGTFPPLAGLQEDNPLLELGDGMLRTLRTAEPWEANGAPRRAGVSSFGFGGTNAHVVLEQAPPRASRTAACGPQLYGLSAATCELLAADAARLATAIRRPRLRGREADVARTLRTGRAERPVVAAIRADDLDALAERLDVLAAGAGHPDVLRGDAAGEALAATPLPDGARVHLPAPAFDHSRRHGHLAPPGDRRARLAENAVEPAPAAPPPGDGAATRGAAGDMAGPPSPGDDVAAEPAPPAAGAGDPSAPRLLARRWVSAPAGQAAPPGGRCLLLLGGATALTTGSLPEGEWLVARRPTPLPRLSAREQDFDLADPEALTDHAGEVAAVVDLVDLDDDDGDPAADEPARIALLQALARRRGTPVRYVHASRGTSGAPGAAPGTRGALMAGLVRAAGAECRALAVTTLDVGHAEPDAARDAALAELRHPAAPEIALRDGTRHAFRLDEVAAPADPGEHSGAWLVTGGLSGVGLAIARHLAARGVRRLALHGRRPLPPPADWERERDAGGERAGTVDALLALQADGVEVLTASGPIEDVVSAGAFAREVRERFGGLQGIVHAAGAYSPDRPPFVAKTPAGMARVFAPKRDGVRVLDDLLDVLGPPRIVVLCSSLSATDEQLAAGLSDYAAANAVLDAHARMADARPGTTRWRAIAWGSWADVGVGAVTTTAFAARGHEPLHADEGLALFDAALALDGEAHVVATCCTPPHAPDQEPEMPDAATPAPDEPLHGDGLVDRVRDVVAAELLLDAADVDPDRSFAELGVDSILLAELTGGVERLAGAPVAPDVLLSHPTCRRLADHLAAAHGLADPSPAEPPSPAPADLPSPVAPGPAPAAAPPGGPPALAIIGMSTRMPGAGSPAELWELVRDGRSAIREAPADRWPADALWSREPAPGRTTSKWAGFIDHIESYDPGAFGIADDAAAHVDPVIRVALECAEQALRDAGIEEPGAQRVGVFAGAGTSTYAARIGAPNATTTTGLNQNFIAAHIAQVHDLRGPNLCVDTACSSSLTALHLAAQALRGGDCEAALVIGADVLLDELPFLKLSAAGALSPDGRCRPFDERANGIVIGEGGGALVLKPLDRAIADGDPIRAVVESVAVNNDGRTMGLTTPNPDAQEALIREALSRAGLDGGALSYVEAHGTGTQVGDPMELRALTRALGETAATGGCAVGSIKPNVGHLLMAAGLAGLQKAVLAIEARMLPPTLGCERPNPRFDLAASPLRLIAAAEPWEPAGDGPRRAGVSSFGFGGTNAHAILREPTADELARRGTPRPSREPATFERVRHWVPRPDRPAPGHADGARPHVTRRAPSRPRPVLELTEEAR